MEKTNVISKGPQHHRLGSCNILGLPWSGSTYSSSTCWVWRGTIGSDSEMADSRIPYDLIPRTTLVKTWRWFVSSFQHWSGQIQFKHTSIPKLTKRPGSFSFPNISIAILITRLLDPDMVRTRCIYSIVGLQVISAIVSILIVFFLCSPTEKLWNPTVPGRCLNPNVLNYFSYWLSAYTTVTDFVLAIIPISVFWRLRMRFSAKLGVCIMMGLTMLSAIVTIIKATYLHLFTEHTDPRQCSRSHRFSQMLTFCSLWRCSISSLGAVSDANLSPVFLGREYDFNSIEADLQIAVSNKTLSLLPPAFPPCGHSSTKPSEATSLPKVTLARASN